MRRGEPLLPVLRLGFADSGVAAITYQAAMLKPAGVLRPGNFFSFFTIQSNVLTVGRVFLNGVGLPVFFAVVAAAFVAVGNRRAARRHRF
jgi:hypothetical protein